MIKDKYFWLKQLIMQISIYVLLYEAVRFSKILAFNLNTGITSRYLFYFFIVLSILLSAIILITKKCNLYYLFAFLTIFILTSSINFFSAPEVIGTIWIIAFSSLFISYYILRSINKKI